jgi:thiopurine S-methyltransferase
MEPGFWIERWREGRIGFHEGRPNQFLEGNVDRLGEHRRVLVPLCGKAEDLAFLAARGHTVVGVELVEDAVRAFFDEHAVVPSIERRDAHVAYTAGAITIVAGDFFAVTRELVGPIDALYDRAALIALPPELRPRYAAHVRSLVAPGSPGIVVTLEYPQEQFQGPPFSVPESELRTRYGDAIELLGESPDDKVPGRTGTERAWAVTL